MELEVHATHGEKKIISGTPIGDFLVHKYAFPVFVGDEERTCWSVTHIKTGARFPWAFVTEQAATGFAREVKDTMEWSKVMVSPGDGVEMKWHTPPTPEQTAAVFECAHKFGGFKP